MDEKIQKAIIVLKQGGIIIFPTDTAFGIGCRIDDEKTVARLFEIRKRPRAKATPVLVDTVKMAKDYVGEVPREVVEKLIEPYWPGALTIILNCQTDKVPALVRGGTQTLGLRIPNHPAARAIIRGLGVPILGPSANFHGEKTPYAFEDIDPALLKLVDYVVPGVCSVKKASTVIDCTKKPWKVLRDAAIQIQNYKLKLKKKVTLFIDTASNEEISVSLQVDKDKDTLKQPIDKQKAQVVLPMIKKLLKKHSFKFADINAIQVNTGPGSYTGLRVGIAIANAFGFALGIPVNNNPIGIFVEPVYS